MQTLLDQQVTDKYAYNKKDSKFPQPVHIPITNDRMAKLMLYNENHKEYISLLLSLILNLKYQNIYDNIIFVKPNIDNSNYYEALRTVDILVNIKNKIYNIEINNIYSKAMLERNIDYINKIYGSKRKKGESYAFDVSIQININNFNFKEDDKVIRTFYLKDEEYILTDKIKIIYISLSKIREKYYNKEKLSKLEEILLIYNGEEGKDLEEEIKKEKILEDYRRHAMNASEIEELCEYMSYNKKEEDEWLKKVDLHYAEERGFELGVKRGTRKQLEESVINFHENGASDELICKSLHITLKRLNRILNKNK